MDDAVVPERMTVGARSANRLLARWTGAHVRLAELTVSLYALRILAVRGGSWYGEPHLEISVHPLWVRGPFEWGDALLRAEVLPAAGTPAAPFTRNEHVYRLHDPVGFELFTENLQVGENGKPFRARG